MITQSINATIIKANGGEIMAYSKAQGKATYKYDSKTYDRVIIKVHKGNKDLIKAKAKREGKSLNGYILGLLQREIPGLE